MHPLKSCEHLTKFAFFIWRFRRIHGFRAYRAIISEKAGPSFSRAALNLKAYALYMIGTSSPKLGKGIPDADQPNINQNSVLQWLTKKLQNLDLNDGNTSHQSNVGKKGI